MQEIYNKIYGDKVIWGVIISLALLSIPIVYVGTEQLALLRGGNFFYFVIKHAIILLSAFVIAYQVSKINHGYLSRVSIILMVFTIPLLLYTMFAGHNVDDASRWIKIPFIGLSFQTSDFAKISLTIYVARVLSRKQGELHSFKVVLKHLFIPIVFVCALIVKSDFSTAFLILGGCFIILFFGGVKMSHFGIILLILILCFTIILLTVPEFLQRLLTWVNRLKAYSDPLHPGNYQKNLAEASIYDGGALGLWFDIFPGKYGQPPQAASDFIYATILRNYGIIGGAFTILMYLVLFFRSIKIARKCNKLFSVLLVIGLSSGLIIQAFSNMAVAVGIFPVTGQPLPMVSMGGTSLWFTAISIGIILSVSREISSGNNDEEIAKSNN
ncbi:MAG: cell division protein FtsW [Flavobacteriales bacterium]|nr:cell division protein FtsW [Flavobacteriales bacterium]MBO73633.1 cell division protein FtsW [Flavobacteriales bacterium]|tara:strand:- start:908 stop:2059 length:1152 start_codon:yes stop_codon:yes gene_type:complete